MCQVQHIDEMGCKRPIRLKIEQFILTTLLTLRINLLVKKMRKCKFSFVRYLRERKADSSIKDSSTGLRHSPPPDIKTGDTVRVRSKEEILQTLDENNRLGGCAFLKEMWQYCGGEYKVVKKMEYFFDEAGARLLKARDLVLLEGIHCSGENIPIFKHPCDRHCLLFWKEAWLEKVR